MQTSQLDLKLNLHLSTVEGTNMSNPRILLTHPIWIMADALLNNQRQIRSAEKGFRQDVWSENSWHSEGEMG